MPAALPVDSVADTALLTAFCRAVESERPDAVFRDPYARLLAGPRGEQLLQRLSGGALTAAGCTVRTSLLDSLIVATLRAADFDTVVNLGAGLDTRPYRLPIAPSILWIEVDQPSVLAYKAERLEPYSPVCALESVPLDVADVGARRIFLARVGAGHHGGPSHLHGARCRHRSGLRFGRVAAVPVVVDRSCLAERLDADAEPVLRITQHRKCQPALRPGGGARILSLRRMGD
jgi:hypothetical protein